MVKSSGIEKGGNNLRRSGMLTHNIYTERG